MHLPSVDQRGAELVEPSWCVIGDGRVINCDVYRIDGQSLELRVRHGVHIIRTRRADTIDEVRQRAAEWRAAAIAQGFKDVQPVQDRV
jgi:hypothetical protein